MNYLIDFVFITYVLYLKEKIKLVIFKYDMFFANNFLTPYIIKSFNCNPKME